MTMTKGERAELRAAVRLQFKVLRGEVDQRHKELLAELGAEIDEEHHRNKGKEDAVKFLVDQAVDSANRAVNDILYEHGLQVKGPTERVLVGLKVGLDFADHTMYRSKGTTEREVAARVNAAKMELDRQEADMLRKLTLDALESDEAQSFFSAIPTASALVPMTRLAELEKALEQ